MRRNRANIAVTDIEQQAYTGAIGALTQAHKLPAGQGVKRMNDPHKLLPWVGTACIWN